MGAFDPRSVDWGRTFAEAVVVAREFRPREAEDIVQQGMTLLLEGRAAFDPDGRETLAQHLVTVGLRDKRNRERTERRRRRPDVAAKLEHWMDDDRPPTPEELSAERDERAKAFERVMVECKDDPDAREIARLEREGQDEAAEQARALGWPIERVRNARKRLSRRVKSLAGGDDGDDDEDEPP